MKYFPFLFLSFLLFTTACKKKESTPPVTNTSTPAEDGSPTSATSFYGIFTTGSYSNDIGGSVSSSTMARAYFSNQAEPAIYLASAVTVNKVYLNTDSLNYTSILKYYTKNSGLNLATETWSVDGGNGIPSFNFTNNIVFPSCSNYTLPDSVSKSVGFSVNINNVANNTIGSILVYDGTNSSSGYYSAPLINGNNSVTITPANLSALATSTNAIVAVVLASNKAFVFSSKAFQFTREIQYTKYIKLKP